MKKKILALTIVLFFLSAIKKTSCSVGALLTTAGIATIIYGNRQLKKELKKTENIGLLIDKLKKLNLKQDQLNQLLTDREKKEIEEIKNAVMLMLGINYFPQSVEIKRILKKAIDNYTQIERVGKIITTLAIIIFLIESTLYSTAAITAGTIFCDKHKNIKTVYKSTCETIKEFIRYDPQDIY